MDNVLVSNHVAGASLDAHRKTGVSAVKNVLDVLDGNRPASPNLVNAEVFDR